MSLKTVYCCLFALLFSPIIQAGEFDLSKFDRVSPSEYADMLRNAASAYGAGRYDQSFELFRRVACAGDKQSQSALGRMYMLGQGVTRDDLTGYAWLKLAAEVIYPKYQSVVRKLEEAMTPEQRQIADARVARLSDRYSLAGSRMSCALSASKGGHIIDRIICTPQREGRRLLLRQCDAEQAD
jgi:TPR repeat protein